MGSYWQFEEEKRVTGRTWTMPALYKSEDLIAWFWTNHPNWDPSCFCPHDEFQWRQDSEEPDRLAAFLLVGVFLDQLMYTHFRGFDGEKAKLYEQFTRQFPYPKFIFCGTPYAGMNSPAALHPCENPELLEETCRLLVKDLFIWLHDRTNSFHLLFQLKHYLIAEATIEFHYKNSGIEKLLKVVAEDVWEDIEGIMQIPTRNVPSVETHGTGTGYPEYQELEEPLLCFIFRNGGPSFLVRASDTYRPLADHFGLTRQERTQTRDDVRSDGRDEPIWHNMVQWARRKLNDKGYLARSPHGTWQLSQAGIAEAERICGE